MNAPRIMIAAVSSGSGKTMITCGILQALVNRGMKVASFKCGPDYIDPMFHENVIGTESKNLDLFLADTRTTKYIFGSTAENSDISVVEGVMGFYDGKGGNSFEASSYDLSGRLDIPVILVVDTMGMSTSAAALVKGFTEFRENNIKGVILNNMDEKIYDPIKEMIEKELKVPVMGYVPPVKELVIESRHLGLLMPHEITGLKEKLNGLAVLLERTLDIDEIIQTARSARDLRYEEPKFGYEKNNVKIGVAKDECFCFIYKDNIELLERFGAEIIYFSPLNDEHLPDDIEGMIIPGGYPELYAERLSGNISMLNEINSRIKEGMPCMAECGGFMYLHDELEDTSGILRKMVSVISGKAFRTEKLLRFGYATITSKNDGILNKDRNIKGHEFHFWESTDCGDDCDAVRTTGERYGCMHNTENLAAGFPHLYYLSDPGTANNFLVKCSLYEKRRGKPHRSQELPV